MKEEPKDPTEEPPFATHSITANNEIVRNVSSAHDVIDGIKTELVDDEDDYVEPVEKVRPPALIIPWPAFVPLGLHPELEGQHRKRKSTEPSATAGATVTSPAVGGSAEKRSRSRIEDVSAHYNDEDADETQVKFTLNSQAFGSFFSQFPDSDLLRSSWD